MKWLLIILLVFQIALAVMTAFYRSQFTATALTYKVQKGIVKKGIPGTPSSSKELEGSYFKGNGRGFDFYLDLRKDGTYRVEWHGCLGLIGEAVNDWKLVGNKIIFSPPSDTNQMSNFIRPLETNKFNNDWILVEFDEDSRKSYKRYGVTDLFCYQRIRPVSPK